MNISFSHEPAAWLGVIRAAVVFGSAFGLKLSLEQTAAIYGILEALTSFIQRQSVTPNAKL